jgi:hypothetical protein
MIAEDLSQYQYTPNEKFEGRTECFQLPEAQIKAIIETVNSFNK